MLAVLCLFLVDPGPARGQADRHWPLTLGETTVWLVAHEQGDGPTLLNLHDDENTAVEAARAYLTDHPGRLLELRHAGTRLLTFALAGQSYSFDPNRMFTDVGAEASLRRQGHYTPEALHAVRAFAEAVLAQVRPEAAPLLVALHNNTDGDWSARSYLPEGDDHHAATAVSLAPGQDPDDFFFVTTQPLFDHLAHRGFNVVLQDNAHAPDDGSLSVWCAQQGLPYANVESEQGHRPQQQAMLTALLQK